jgi:hypothetical protein
MPPPPSLSLSLLRLLTSACPPSRRQSHVRDEKRDHKVLDAARESPKRPNLGAQVSPILPHWLTSLSRPPFSRHIARTCVVEDEGIEMKDAAAKKVM